ncbi:hypothetical protein [Clostridium thailandense]|uniref:hypothetical protein n=1 Tax=Clostridium thailandense TaxID=2794346 RepID=UPI003989A4C9
MDKNINNEHDLGYNILYTFRDELQVKLNLGYISSFVHLESGEGGILDPGNALIERDKFNPKVIYMPAEINFDKLKKVDNTFKF